MTNPSARPAPPALDDLIEQMRGYSTYGDFEVAHSEADALMKEALLRLAKAFDEELAKKAQEFVDLYENVEKWYA